MEKVKIFIDGENMSCTLIEEYLNISKEYGEIISKKVYGDFTNQTLTSWNKTGKEYGMDLVQVSSSGKGKSTTDIKLIVDLLRDFYNNRDNIFVIVTNDSDFVEVGKVIREENGFVVNIHKSECSNTMQHTFTRTHSVDISSRNTSKKIASQSDEMTSSNVDANKILEDLKNIVSKNTKGNEILISQVTEELYEKYSKNDVQKAIGYSKNTGIKKGIEKLGIYNLKTVGTSTYICLKKDKVSPKKTKDHKTEVIDNITELTVKYSEGDDNWALLSTVANDLYKIIDKDIVKEVLKFTNKEGLAKGLLSLPNFEVKQEKIHHYIRLKPNISSKTEVNKIIHEIKKVIDNEKKSKKHHGYVEFQSVSNHLIKVLKYTKDDIKEIFHLESYKRLYDCLENHGFKFIQHEHNKQNLTYIKY